VAPLFPAPLGARGFARACPVLAVLCCTRARPGAASKTSWVFNWRAEGWGGGYFISETHDFGDGVSGGCVLRFSSDSEHSHCIVYRMLGLHGLHMYSMHATFSILDQHDKILRKVDFPPFEVDLITAHTAVWCNNFTPTAAVKAHSVRADGSIRLRAEVRLFLN